MVGEGQLGKKWGERKRACNDGGKTHAGPCIWLQSRRGRRKCRIGLLKGPVLRPSTALGGSTREIDDSGNQLTPEGMPVDPSEKDEQKSWWNRRSSHYWLTAHRCRNWRCQVTLTENGEEFGLWLVSLGAFHKFPWVIHPWIAVLKRTSSNSSSELSAQRSSLMSMRTRRSTLGAPCYNVWHDKVTMWHRDFKASTNLHPCLIHARNSRICRDKQTPHITRAR